MGRPLPTSRELFPRTWSGRRRSAAWHACPRSGIGLVMATAIGLDTDGSWWCGDLKQRVVARACTWVGECCLHFGGADRGGDRVAGRDRGFRGDDGADR